MDVQSVEDFLKAVLRFTTINVIQQRGHDMVDNWIENKSKTRWRHKKNPNVFVLIRKNIELEPGSPKYLVFHTHPGPGTHTIMQGAEGALTMESARKKANKHLRHWGPSENWSQDPDYGKIGKVGT